jgi:protein KRI1
MTMTYKPSGASNIMSHPRDIPSLVRRADDTRKSKRAARAERKAAEQAARDEEMRRRKGEKRREMDSRLASLKKDVGDGVDWGEVVKLLEGNYDERDWDRVVGGMLSHMKDIEDDEVGLSLLVDLGASVNSSFRPMRRNPHGTTLEMRSTMRWSRSLSRKVESMTWGWQRMTIDRSTW